MLHWVQAPRDGNFRLVKDLSLKSIFECPRRRGRPGSSRVAAGSDVLEVSQR